MKFKMKRSVSGKPDTATASPQAGGVSPSFSRAEEDAATLCDGYDAAVCAAHSGLREFDGRFVEDILYVHRIVRDSRGGERVVERGGYYREVGRRIDEQLRRHEAAATDVWEGVCDALGRDGRPDELSERWRVGRDGGYEWTFVASE